MQMSTGQMILTIGIVLIVTGALTTLIGECLLYSQKKNVLRRIDKEYH